MEPCPTENWVLKIDGCGLSARPKGDACEHLPGKRSREALGRARLGSGVTFPSSKCSGFNKPTSSKLVNG